MVTKTLGAIVASSPSIKRALWKIMYQAMAGRFQLDEWTFMNYGYADIDEGKLSLPLDTADETDRYGIQLYHAVAGAVDHRGCDVLEIGSGRGGGTSYIARYLGPKTVTGVDFSEKAVRLSQKRHGAVTGLSFKQGDAENLPFPEASFDAVVNVESSHCYGSMDKFLSEVARVLRPGGRFCWTDMLQPHEVQTNRDQFQRAGLTIVEEENITPNVILALDRAYAKRRAMIHGHVPRMFRGYMEDFAGAPGTRVYDSFVSGEVGYWRCVATKR